mgnify:CR=1 FL=1
MLDQSTFTLVNPQNGNLAFKLSLFEDNFQFKEIQRLNYFSLIWIKKGKGKVKVDKNFPIWDNRVGANDTINATTFTGGKKLMGFEYLKLIK